MPDNGHPPRGEPHGRECLLVGTSPRDFILIELRRLGRCGARQACLSIAGSGIEAATASDAGAASPRSLPGRCFDPFSPATRRRSPPRRSQAWTNKPGDGSRPSSPVFDVANGGRHSSLAQEGAQGTTRPPQAPKIKLRTLVKLNFYRYN